ncbi:DUF1294 domain-containing protein [Pseudomonas capeferrum]|uniref:DUF1294 domain-containing protein n=1 Tax=Pseudomonas capeferrum TaxID=1495066 RepID=UPI0015E382D1|nr:DUF1294 domain-containing protein [Pseudomonas capeferrum]MBA1202677.1 DUF1294 domain-containing protein [Pseudomonas capeferrum]
MASVRTAGRRGVAKEEGVRNVRLKLLALGALCLLPGIGAVRMVWLGDSWMPSLAYVLGSLASLALYWHDKRQAKAQARRVPEKVLHASELLGGWPGALLAQQLFRHKTRKVSYQLAFWAIVGVHQLFWIYWLFGMRWMIDAVEPLFR